jgi:putative Holliday junction resolvase
MSEWVKAMGLDYGTARIGIAVSDDLGMLAHPLETVSAANRAAALNRIVELVAKRGIRDLVIGCPLRLDGSEGSAVEKVRRFGKELVALLPETIRLHEVDESFSTIDAMAKLHQAGRKAHNVRGIIDQAAAVEILQRWLDREAGL